MAYVYIPESQPDSQPSGSQRNEYVFEATQVSQPRFSQTQNTQNAWENSQVDPRRKYWATFIPTNSSHSIIKLPWSKHSLQLGRGAAQVGNDVVLNEKRVSNRHCKITLGFENALGEGSSGSRYGMGIGREADAEPEVWIEDLGSSNGTFVNGQKITPRRLLQHGDEISLGHMGTLENHDVRYIYRSVGAKGMKHGQTVSNGGMGMVGEVYERYQILEKLGKGTFAEVMRAVDVETGDLRAIKQIIKHRFAGNAKTLALFQREIQISSDLHHENICRLIEHYEDPQHICLVLEYVDGGDLLDHITEYPSPNGGGLPEDYAANLTLQICRAMAYTHSMGVTHRDLKPENILLTKATADCPAIVKVADFGLAKMVDAATMLKSMVGTPQYLAPEVVMQTKENVGYENVVDSWSVGIIVYSMLTKALPFDEDPEVAIEKRIKARFTQEFDTRTLLDLGVSDTAIDFISALLAKNPAERMSMESALIHEWLAGPSSQPDSQIRQTLGGDSMWSIESFDDYDDDRLTDAEMDLHPTDQIAGSGWDRQMTASATNHDRSYQSSVADLENHENGNGIAGQVNTSGISDRNGNGNENGNSVISSSLVRHHSSGESFSQPMGNLRLTTPARINGNGAPRPTSNLFDGSLASSNGTSKYQPSSLSLGINFDQSPPSPPLTDVPLQLEMAVAESPARPLLTTPPESLPLPHVQTTSEKYRQPPSPLPTPIITSKTIPSSITNKRKLLNDSNGPPEVLTESAVHLNDDRSPEYNDQENDQGKEIGMFSSGSLSPLPESPADTKRPVLNTRGSTPKPGTPIRLSRTPRSAGTKRSTRRSGIASVNGAENISSVQTTPVRQSSRITKGRKSMRLS